MLQQLNVIRNVLYKGDIRDILTVIIKKLKELIVSTVLN